MKNPYLAFVFGVVGASLIGVHFNSLLVAIGVYFCVAAVGNWP